MLRKLFFNLTYFKGPVWDTGISPPELMDFIASHEPGRAIDLGCGTGTNIITLAKAGWQATGVDFALRALQIARRKARENEVKVNIHVDSVTNLRSITGPYELILDIGCYHALSPTDHQKYKANIDRLLSPGGTYLLYAFLTGRSNFNPGITEEDINNVSKNLKLLNRVATTERYNRPSAWFTFQK